MLRDEYERLGLPKGEARRCSFARFWNWWPANVPVPGSTPPEVNPLVQVLVRDNNVDQALRALKKKMQREGIFREMKLRNYYEKPSEKKAREKAEAVRRARKLARKKMQREGLLPGKPVKPTGPGGKPGAEGAARPPRPPRPSF